MAVREALARPLIGHLDPAFLALLDELQQMILRVFRAPDGSLALPISGTGSPGMEACLVNLLDPGDTLLVGVNGVFGERRSAIGDTCPRTRMPIFCSSHFFAITAAATRMVVSRAEERPPPRGSRMPYLCQYV